MRTLLGEAAFVRRRASRFVIENAMRGHFVTAPDVGMSFSGIDHEQSRNHELPPAHAPRARPCIALPFFVMGAIFWNRGHVSAVADPLAIPAGARVMRGRILSTLLISLQLTASSHDDGNAKDCGRCWLARV